MRNNRLCDVVVQLGVSAAAAAFSTASTDLEILSKSFGSNRAVRPYSFMSSVVPEAFQTAATGMASVATIGEDGGALCLNAPNPKVARAFVEPSDGNSGFSDPASGIIYVTRARIDPSTGVMAEFGFWTDASDDLAEFYADDSNANWQARCRKGGANLDIDTGFPKDDQPHTFVIAFVSPGDVAFYADGNLLATHTNVANIPTVRLDFQSRLESQNGTVNLIHSIILISTRK